MSEITSDIERYTRLLERDPDSRVFAPLAEACRKANRHQEALDIARAGVERHPTYASGRVALARAQLSLEQYEDAARELDQAIAHAPENALAYRLLGEARRSLGQPEAAFEAFARALALNPEDGEARDAVAILEQEAPVAVAPEHPPPVFAEAGSISAPAPAASIENEVPLLEAAEAPEAAAAEAGEIWPSAQEEADTGQAEEAAPDTDARELFEEIPPAVDEITLTDEITGHEDDGEPPARPQDESAGTGVAAELDLALEPIGESDPWPGEPDTSLPDAPLPETPLEDSHAQAPAEPETPLPEPGPAELQLAPGTSPAMDSAEEPGASSTPDFGPAFGPDAASGFGGSTHESVIPADFGEEGGVEAADSTVDAGAPAHPSEASTGGDVPLERFLDDLDIGQSSLAPEARESTPAGPAVEGLLAAPAEKVETAEIPAPEKDELPEERPPAVSAIPLDSRVEELADQYRELGHPHRARALYRALLDGDPMNLGARRKLEELGEDLQPSTPVPPPHDQMVRVKVEENIDSLNRWLANIKKGAAR